MSKPVSYKRHRFPPEIIAHAVWLYFRFPLSLRLVEEMLLERGIVVSYETVRRWALKFGPAYARRLRRKTPSRRDIWHLDEVVVTISGQKYWLWWAVDQDGYVLDEIVQSRRNTTAAKRLLRRLLRKQGCPPRRMITDKLSSYAAAQRQVMPAVEHRSHKAQQSGGEFASAVPSTRASDAGLPVAQVPAAVRQYLFCRPQSFRSTPLRPFRSCHPSALPQRHGGIEGYGQHCCLSLPGDQIGLSAPARLAAINVTTLHRILGFAYTVLPLTRSSGFLTSELTSSLNEINHLRCCMNGQGVRGVAWPWRDVGRHFAGKVELPIGYVGEQRNQQVLQRNHPNAKLHQLGIRQVRHLGLRIRGG